MHADDQSVFDTLDRSVPGRMVASCVAAWDRASTGSRIVGAWRGLGRGIADVGPAARMSAFALTVLMAALTNVALNWSTRPPGVYWLLLPGLAMVFSAIALVLAAAAPGRANTP